MAGRDRSPDIANLFWSWFKWFAGTAFPTTKFLYRPYFRTDLGWLCYWDGTRWLTLHELSMAFTPVILVNTNDATIYIRNRTDYAPYFTRIAVTTYTAATNDGTHYWTITFRGIDLTFGAVSNVLAFNTSGDTADTFTSHEAAPGTANPTKYTHFQAFGTKTSTPGNCTLFITAYYRLIVT